MVVRRECEACGLVEEVSTIMERVNTALDDGRDDRRFCWDCDHILNDLRDDMKEAIRVAKNKMITTIRNKAVELIQEERGRRNRDEARGEGQGGTGTGNQEFYRAASEPPPESEGGSEEGVERKDTNSAGGGDRTEDPNLRQSHFPRCEVDELRPDAGGEEGSGGSTGSAPLRPGDVAGEEPD